MSFKLGLYDLETTYPEQKRFDGENAVINKSTVGEFEAASQKNTGVADALTDPKEKDQFVGFSPS